MRPAAFAANFVDRLTEVQMPRVFNPYRDLCPHHDLPDAPAVRRENLHQVLEAAARAKVDVLWVGLELGRRGGRRTGLPLTDEPRIPAMAAYWGTLPLKRATKGPEMREDTASFIWRAIPATPKRVFLWNVFPFQCHSEGTITNRNHRPDEARQVAHLLRDLLSTLQPKEVVALGRPAEAGLRRLGLEARYVRHPGRGGGPEFLANIHG
jgi:hypothetical protein